MTSNLEHLRILNFFCLKSSNFERLNPSKTAQIFINRNYDKIKDMLDYLNSYCNDLTEEDSICEKLYRIKYDLIDRPTCVVCGGYVKFWSFTHGYYKHCCKKCACDDEHNKTTFKQSILQNKIKKHPEYGVDLSVKSHDNDIIIGRLFLLSNGNFDGNKCDLSKRWCVKNKQFVDYVLTRYTDSSNIIENVYRMLNHIDNKPTCIICGAPVKFDDFVNGYHKTCSNSCSHKTDDYKNKYINSCLKLFGCEYALQNTDVRKKCNETFKQRIIDGYYDKGLSEVSVYSSKFEKTVFEILSKQFKNVVQYKRDERYSNPRNGYKWECDFYVEDVDLFVECQGFATHGKHPYNKLDKDDIETLNNLKELANKLNNKNGTTHCFFDDVINTWTKNDVYKRYVAKKNKLNYLEIFYDDLDENIIMNKINTILTNNDTRS